MDDVTNFSRNLIGSLSTIIGLASGLVIAQMIFGISKSQLQFAGSIALVVELGQYAALYHKSIVDKMSLVRFGLIALVSSFPASFVISALSKTMNT